LVLPIVAIGASAGGLEAISELLGGLRPKSAMAYVVIQHLDPEHKSLLPEILAKKTPMSVEQIHDGLVVQANHVYVIPPNTALTLSEDRFRLTRRASEGPHHPVDVFFSSLADAQGEAAIGVVLSGGDSDGSLGVQQIKHSGGITFAQRPESAKFPSMPQNAIETGCVDFVLRPSAIAQELTLLGDHPYLRQLPHPPVDLPQADDSGNEEDFKRVFRRLRSVHGVDFAHYKRSTLQRRLGRRMAVRKIEVLSDYVSVLEDEPAEAAALYQDFLIRVTSFFRDPESFDILSARVFPRICEGRTLKDPVRIWVPGCASGEEVYSIAIALLEYLGNRLPSIGIQIFGTDVSEAEIEKARAGHYLANIAEEISSERLQRFFVKQDHHYRIAKSVRDLCIFARQDITRDPSFSRLDLVSCRNLLIYLDAAAQRRVMQVFHYSLRSQGFLLLGPSESVGSTDLFETIDKQQRLYSRKMIAPSAVLELRQRSVAPNGHQNTANETDAPLIEIDSAQRQADRLLLAHYAPASLLVDEEFNILQFRGETGPYIEHASGSSSLNLHRVVRPELLVEISPAITEARETGSTVHRTGLTIDDRMELVLKVIPLKASSAYNCYLIIFEDATNGPSRRRGRQSASSTLPESEKDRRLAQLERDIAATRDYMQSTIEEHEAVKEELKSAHEEVLSANEEFQSTNEELETAKEEMQAANEELIITNDELRNRNRELSVVNGELKLAEAISEQARGFADAIVRTVRDALLVLDDQMHILRANGAYYARFNTLSEETEGRLFQHVQDGQWNIPELLERLAAVLNRDVALENFEVPHSDLGMGPRVLRLNARKVPGDAQRANLILLTIEDVTLEKIHSKQAEMEAQEHRNEVAHLLRVASIGELSAALAHELNQPLTAILTNAQAANLMLRDQFDLDEIRSILNDIITDNRRASQVISRLRNLLKKSEFELEKLNANELLREVLKLMNHELRARQVRVATELAAGLPSVLGDRVQLQQVLINLILNASEAMSRQPEKTRMLTLKSRREGGVVQISVADTGSGIPAGDEEKIFERYHTTKSQGLGLGLSLSRSILLAHGGRLWAENQAVGGAALHFTLPKWKVGAKP
jgi:two-component system, chemotaxis family, CheB/CheR fusion protein